MKNMVIFKALQAA